MRNVKYDNCKAILIVLVVFGHMLELDLGYGINRYLYLVIYSFHMPFFVYLTGYFAKTDPIKWIKKLLLPYVVFQTLYILFQTYILMKPTKLQYTQPYWILWYLVAVLFWNLLLAGIRNWKKELQYAVLFVAILVSLLVGYVDWIGRELTLSRMLVFFPFFLWGYLARQRETCREIFPLETKKQVGLWVMIPIVLILVGVLWVKAPLIKVSWLYEANSYQTGGYSIWMRLFHLLSASAWIVVLRQRVTSKRIPVLSYLGQNTMPIYLMHGFVIKWIGMF